MIFCVSSGFLRQTMLSKPLAYPSTLDQIAFSSRGEKEPVLRGEALEPGALRTWRKGLSLSGGASVVSRACSS
jgi:hypothetical protein